MKKRFMHTSEMDLTKGHLFWKIPLFALPLALTTFLQLLYTSIDLFSVATWGEGSISMSAIGSNGSLINLIVTVFLSLSLGANVAIANAKGSKNKEHAEKVLHTSLMVAVASGIVVGLIGAFISPYLLRWMGTNDIIYDKAVEYLTIYFIGLPFFMIYNYCAQILRALGDSRRPLYILLIAGIINVLADFVFVYFFHLDVAGVAWATVISEAISAGIAFLILYFNKGFVRFRFSKSFFDNDSFKEIMRIGLPAGVQGLAFSIPNVLIQSSLYTIVNSNISNNDIVVGSAASGNVEGYIYALIDSCASACIAFTGQNYGAKNKKNCRKVFWYSNIWAIIFWAISATICLIFGRQLLDIFINDGNGVNVADAIEAGYERLWVLAVSYFLDAIMDVCSSYLRGMKYSTIPAIITIVGCTVSRIIFLVWLFPMPYFHTVIWLYAVFPISWIITDLSYLVAILLIEPHAFKKIEKQNETLKEKNAN